MPEQRVVAKRYELREALDSGGMGQIWRANDRILGRDVAVKLILDNLAVRGEVEAVMERFRREVQVTARLRHANIPQVYDAVLDGAADRMFMVMELVQGDSLRDLMGASRGLPTAWVVCLALHVCAALDHAHEVPVVHRDIKPENIMIAIDGAVKVLDFGIAMMLGTDAPSRLTKRGHLVGSPHYMAPEQFAAGHITPRTDLYALGVVLYELLAGKPPFDGGNVVNLIYAHSFLEPASVRSVRPDIDARLDLLILKLLAKRPDERPGSARHVIEELLLHLPDQHPGYVAFPGLPVLAVPPVLIPDTSVPRPADRLSAAQNLFDAGELRAALLSFEALADELGRLGGESEHDVRTCRIQAARCRIGLGEHQRALRDLQSELSQLREQRADTDSLALHVRLEVGLLLCDVHRFGEAAQELSRLYNDLVLKHGPDAPLADRVRQALIGIRRRPPGGR